MLSRRNFLAAIGQLAAGAAAAQVEGIAGLINAVASTSGNARISALGALIKRRQQLLVGDMDSEVPSLDELWSNYRDDITTMESKYLARVDWDASLLTPEEVKLMTAEATQLKAKYKTAADQLEGEISRIDRTLHEYPGDVKAAVKSQAEYYDLQERANSLKTPAAERVRLQAQLNRMPDPEVDFETINDVRSVAEGSRPDALGHIRDSAVDMNRDLDNVMREVRDATSGPRPKDWEKKRQQAHLDYARAKLKTLATDSHIHIESSLDKGYGNDNWRIASRMHSSQIGGEDDQDISEALKSLKSALEIAYPERMQPGREPFLRHERPMQPGYGEHDCERLTITNPDFALRQALAEALREHLKRRHAEKPLARAASIR
ncbi:MAG: hypothetical protein EBV03_01540 [Proteobacteria bacterium]|nr:hypothetical protein [Pseudomonadota bacterium]